MPPSDAPSVTVVIPVYNGANSIARAIAQDFSDFEIVVVDDRSTYATREVIRPLAAQIRVIEQANAGPAVARNTGIAAARGEYIAFLDADDAWMPAKLGLLVAALRRDPSAVLAFSDVVPIDPDDRRVAAALIPRSLAHAPLRDAHAMVADLSERGPHPACDGDRVRQLRRRVSAPRLRGSAALAAGARKWRLRLC